MADEKYISPEEYQASSKQAPPKKTITFSTHTTSLIIVVVLLCGLSFVGGVSYQKHHQGSAKTTATGTTSGFRGRGGFGQRGGGAGQVTAISSTSITVQDQRTNTPTTYSITSSTAITDSGQTVTSDNIKTGDTVIVVPSGSGSSTTASRILVNPNFGGSGASPDQPNDGSTSQSE